MAVPKLRFGCKDWKSVELQNIAQRVTRKNSQNETDLPLTISSLDGLVDQREYFKKQVASKDMSGYYLIYRGEFAYNKSYSAGFNFGSVKRLNKYAKGALSTLYICFSLKDVVNSDFFVGYFDSCKWNRHVSKVCTEGARNHGLLNISADDFMKMRIYLPDVAEQQKIADFLTTFDKRIAAQQNIIADLEETKKGLLQKIFNQEIRFKDDNGQEFPRWKVQHVSDVCDINPKSDNSIEQKFYYIDIGSVDMGVVSLQTPIQSLNAPSRAQRILKEGDVLFQTVRPYQMGHYYFNKCNDFQTVASTGYAQLRCKGSNEALFIYQLLYTDNFNKDVRLRCTGTSYPAINSSDLATIKIKVPVIEEQQKIAAFLSTFDKKISAEKQILSDLQEIKRGLLQQMFV